MDKFFLRAVTESADMVNTAALEIYHLHQKDRKKLQDREPTAYTIQVYDEFCRDPILTRQILVERHQSTNPKIQRAFNHLLDLDIIHEISGKQRNRRYAYKHYLEIKVPGQWSPFW